MAGTFPTSFSTGKVSPVRLDSSLVSELPSRSKQSAGIMSPVFTLMISPMVKFALSNSLKEPSLKTADVTLTDERSFLQHPLPYFHEDSLKMKK